MDGPVLSTDGVSLIYGDGDERTFALRAVSLAIPPRSFCGIMGPSGSGKSSLLYLLSGLKSPSEGEVFVGERPLSSLKEPERARLRRERFGFVFQQPFLLPYLTAWENVLIAAGPGETERGAAARADELLGTLGLSRLGHHFPHQLSGGERQRVAVARALMNRPEVVFADEPTASLDHRNGHAVVDLLTSHRGDAVVIVVTHDPEMLTGADLVFSLRDGELQAPDAAIAVPTAAPARPAGAGPPGS